MTKVDWTEPAVDDLAAIVEFIARDSETYATATAEQILNAVEALQSFPRMGRLVPEARSASTREILVLPYRIIYRVKRSRVQILAVIHGARDIGAMRPKPWIIR